MHSGTGLACVPFDAMKYGLPWLHFTGHPFLRHTSSTISISGVHRLHTFFNSREEHGQSGLHNQHRFLDTEMAI
jgi:hypothetical protein